MRHFGTVEALEMRTGWMRRWEPSILLDFAHVHIKACLSSSVSQTLSVPGLLSYHQNERSKMGWGGKCRQREEVVCRVDEGALLRLSWIKKGRCELLMPVMQRHRLSAGQQVEHWSRMQDNRWIPMQNKYWKKRGKDSLYNITSIRLRISFGLISHLYVSGFHLAQYLACMPHIAL
jgi:hypothetical protein